MQSVREFYNKYNYLNIKYFKKKQFKNNKKLLEKILSYAHISLYELKNKRVLDAGCGTGEKTFILEKYAKEVVAIDFAENQLKIAKTKSKKTKFFLKDIINDNLEDLGKFDLILCLGVLHHTENPKLGFEKLVKLLNKDGIIIIGLYHKFYRLRYRIIRYFLHKFITQDKIMDFIKKHPFGKLLNTAPESTLYDRYVVPYESYHTLKEVKKWFYQNNLNILNYSENLNRFYSKKSIFFVAGKKVR